MAKQTKTVPAVEPAASSLDLRLPAHELLEPEWFAQTSGFRVETVKIQQIAALLWLPDDITPDERDATIVQAIDLFDSIKPAEGLEAMLAVQMVGTHHAVMECLRRAMLPEQTLEGRNQALAHAQRLMALYVQQMAALDKHRGKGQQKITVERVEVAAGGQAIVGHVETPAVQSLAPPVPQALEAPREDGVPLPPVRSRDKVRR